MQLILEHAPHAQLETSKSFSGGQLVIGRNDDCDWQLEDPDRYVSRQHCTITDESGEITVIDSSTDGLYVDGASQPVGSGNSVVLEHDMRLRVGDFVIRVDMKAAAEMQGAPIDEAPARKPFDFGADDAVPYEKPERPDGLPEKFGTRKEEQTQRLRQDEKQRRSAGGYDPFELDLKKAPEQEQTPEVDRTSPSRGGGYFDTTVPQPPVRQTSPSEKDEGTRKEPESLNEEPLNKGPWPPIEVTKDIEGEAPETVQIALEETTSATPPPPPGGTVADESETLAALLRGLGVDQKLQSGMTVEEVEALGARFREMVDGVMFLLRTRAQEKQKVRVAQTLIASREVNPLKFLASADEAIIALIRARDTSYLPGDKAVTGAFRDLADHQVRTWSALQTALRRMIDRFDPKEVEREMSDTGLLETLVAGGRSAKMWQLYEERYRDIAEAAEQKFLGEVGSDFRDAYETERT